ncbi:sugar kinase [Nonomuraea purpurea]|uniref:Sugar kinase n=1 Tax=Nonomuraea purpurea TaxID=1849276 RepID=A0ABV8GFC3_9ACTN
MTDVYTLGEPLGVVSSGRVRHESEARLDVCGPEFTLAVALARLGHRTAYLGKVGDDEVGARVLTVLKGEGVDAADMRVSEGLRTGLLLRESRVGREPKVTQYRTGCAGSRLTPGNVPIDRIAASKMLHVTGLTAGLGRDAQEAVRTAVNAAKNAGVMISFAVEYVPELWPSVRDAERVLGELACDSHLLFLRQDELDLVKPALTPAREVVVDRGVKGASVRADRMRYDVQGWQVPIVDTSGAGEAFAAGYISAALDGLIPQERLHRGALLSAAAVTSVSDWQGLPTRGEL